MRNQSKTLFVLAASGEPSAAVHRYALSAVIHCKLL